MSLARKSNKLIINIYLLISRSQKNTFFLSHSYCVGTAIKKCIKNSIFLKKCVDKNAVDSGSFCRVSGAVAYEEGKNVFALDTVTLVIFLH